MRQRLAAWSVLFLLFWLDPSTVLRLPMLLDEEELIQRLIEAKENPPTCEEIQDVDGHAPWSRYLCRAKQIRLERE